nr:hypothetical protein [uncultured Acetatifactor sp.]
MEFRENVDDLMSCVTVSEGMRRAILEGNPEKAGHRAMSRTGAGTEGGMDMGNGRNRKRGHSAWRRAAVPAAAALLVMSTMYVGAGYLMDHTPLRDIFATRDDSALPVPQAQQRPDIYGEILDASFSASEAQTETGEEPQGAADGAEASAETVPRGRYGEIVMDNELFSIELLETTCAGREMTASYILTKKTDQYLTVNVSIDNNYLGQWKEGLAGEDIDSDRMLMKSGFGDTFRWNNLPEGCGYELEENQELCIITQLGKADYAPGTYTLYAESYYHEAPAVEDQGESFRFVEIPDEDVQSGFYKTSIEIQRSGDYGLALSGALDKTEDQVHFDRYDVYVSPMTVYLTLYGTYEGEISSIWGMGREHDITIVFQDGTQTQATVLLSSMGYGSGKLDVDMRASFDTAIDPDAIVRVLLDGVAIMGE